MRVVRQGLERSRVCAVQGFLLNLFSDSSERSKEAARPSDALGALSHSDVPLNEQTKPILEKQSLKLMVLKHYLLMRNLNLKQNLYPIVMFSEPFRKSEGKIPFLVKSHPIITPNQK